MKTGRDGLSVVQVNYAFDNELSDPDALLARYATLTGWADALLAAGAQRSRVVQRFHRDAHIVRNAVEYVLVSARMADAVASLSPDVAHVNGLIFGAQTWRLRRALSASTAIVAQNHSDTGPMGRAPWPRLIGRATRHAVDGFLFAADEHAARWRRAGFIAPHQPAYQVMEASSRLQPVLRTVARAATGVLGRPAMIWVGRLNANKDPLVVLDAFERIGGSLPNATLTMIYSESDLVREVRTRIDGSGMLRERVRLAGAVPHDRIAAYLSAADLFIVGSHHEGSGYALIEALACGTTPVVTDIPSFRLLTGGGRVGVLWQPGDAADCSRAMAAAARSDGETERAAVRAHFERHLSWSVVGQRAMAIYRDVVTARRR